MITVDLPLRLESMPNQRKHWTAKARQTKRCRNAAVCIPRHPLPCIVTLVRVAPRKLDGDNLQGAFKPLRDGIADRLGVKDNDPRVEWRYGQMRRGTREYAVRVCMQHLADPEQAL